MISKETWILLGDLAIKAIISDSFRKIWFFLKLSSHCVKQLIEKWGFLDVALGKHRILFIMLSLCANMFRMPVPVKSRGHCICLWIALKNGLQINWLFWNHSFGSLGCFSEGQWWLLVNLGIWGEYKKNGTRRSDLFFLPF